MTCIIELALPTRTMTLRTNTSPRRSAAHWLEMWPQADHITLNIIGKMGKSRREVVEYINPLSQNNNWSLTGLSQGQRTFDQ